MKDKGSFKISTGASSILMIFVMLCLTTFSVLSYVTANADNKMTVKSNANIKAYYRADSEAQEILMKIDAALSQVNSEEAFQQVIDLTNAEINGIAVKSETGSPVFSFEIIINSVNKLDIALEAKYLKEQERAVYDILRYKSFSMIEWESDRIPGGIWEG